MSETALIRLAIVVAGVILVAAIWYFGTRPRSKEQGRRIEGDARGRRSEPTLGDEIEASLADAPDPGSEAQVQSELELLDSAVGAPTPGTTSELGRRNSDDFDKIVTLYVAARAGEVLRGADILVAAERAGLTYGHMNVFHRLIDGHPERGPIFSVANIKKPGSFEMAEIQSLETPAIAFFLTLPAPINALDAWEAMQPTAQRMAELLNGVVLDEQRNALGRQRIAYLRDEMRAYDRQRETPPITRSPRW